MNREAESIIRDILIQELSLDPQNIWIRNQNVTIPEDEEVYFSVGMVDAQVISNTNQIVDSVDGMDEIQQVQIRENVQIDIFSRGTEPLTQRWAIVAAMVSVFSRQQQELEQFRIFSIPTNFVNTSSAEGGSEINRFSITIPCFVWYRNDQAIPTEGGGDFYDTFDTRVDDEDTIGTPEGIIEFTIDENTEL